MFKLCTTAIVLFGLGACASTNAEGDIPASYVEPSSQAPATYRAPRIPGSDVPDFNGVWRVLNTANYNIEAHAASAALQLRAGPYSPVPHASVVALGAIGAVPAGLGIVQGDGKIPYRFEALAERDANRARAVDLDPEVKCYLPGIPRANYMDKPFQTFQSAKPFSLPTNTPGR